MVTIFFIATAALMLTLIDLFKGWPRKGRNGKRSSRRAFILSVLK